MPVGHESWAEYVDYRIQGKLLPSEATFRLNTVLPEGIKIIKTQEISLKYPSIFDNIYKAFYFIRFLNSYGPPGEKVDQFLREENVRVFWPRKNKSFDLKSAVEHLSFVDEHTLKMVMYTGPDGSMRPEEALDFIFGWVEGKRPLISVEKFQVQFRGSDDVQ